MDTTTCTTPSWDSAHPDLPTLEWPTFWKVTIGELVGAHPAISLEEPLFLVREPDLVSRQQMDTTHVFSATTWGGHEEVLCDGESIVGKTVVLTAYLYQANLLVEPVDDAEVFAAATAQADELGVTPVVDEDVALDESEQVRLP